MRNRRRLPPQPFRVRYQHSLAAVLRLLVGAALAVALVTAATAVARLDLDALHPVEHIEMRGDLRHLNPDEVRQLMQAQAQGYFSADLRDLQDALLQLPWVERAQLRRRWPDTLEVWLEEPVPVARWGEDRLVDRRGQIFGPVDQLAWTFLPALQGEAGRQVELMHRYLDASARLADAGLEVTGIEETARQAWQIHLAEGGKVLMGRDADLARLDQLVALLPIVRQRNPEPLARVDLRYPRGLAVAWQAPESVTEGGTP